MKGSQDHLTKSEIRCRLIVAETEGRLYDCTDVRLREEILRGSLDRFCEVAFQVQGMRRVLDVGSGTGLLASALKVLGHEVVGIDITARADIPDVYQRHGIEYQVCNAEVDRFPFGEGEFDAVVCGQTLEHFTGSHLPAMRETFRVLRRGGRVEIDVPNVANFRNRLRLLRGKNITWDYGKSYLHAEPILYAGHSFYPLRHNREFTRDEVELLLKESGFIDVRAWHFCDTNRRHGLEQLRDIGSWLRNRVPGWRKSIMGVGHKP